MPDGLPVTEFANQSRFDPYKNFKFRINWEGRYVAGVSKVSPLPKAANAVEHSASDPSRVSKSRGRTKCGAITLERGLTLDVEFERWANMGRNLGSDPGSEVAARDFRRDLAHPGGSRPTRRRRVQSP
jgi:phage tail-like protein